MNQREVIIIGSGPAGLSAAGILLRAGAHVAMFERSPLIGGQLIKQTHKFFGSQKQYAKTRGYDIAKKLYREIEAYQDHFELHLEATVVAIYPDRVISVYQQGIYQKYQAEAIIIATGASERLLSFPNNDLPGIYGAGAVQTLMNLYGVLPGKNAVMVGSGNIGLIVSYQMMQAGVNVKAVLEAAPNIGGYKVHASKLRRLGVPIMTQTTVKRAIGMTAIEAIETIRLDEKWQPIEDTETTIPIDTLCISVGLTPMHQLLSMAGAEMRYISELGGCVPHMSSAHETSIRNIFACGDVTGIEEASSAIVEGQFIGLIVSERLGYALEGYHLLKHECTTELGILRCGPFGEKIRLGQQKLKGGSSCSND
ncbi:MAG: NAD(P)/FAD-dependent oxidoreductase [Candidatus Izemoplasmatales bacterium]|nr:NAD(P)/FAD-dependent oxidoreductase [Candidatus Izemoplasmatales bacterium]